MTDRLRQEAWDYGRSLRDQLLTQYREEYGEDVPPPPAKIADQLLTDFLGANLRFDPLPLNIYARTEWKDDRPVVTVNSFTGQIPGVKDVEGIQNVAMLHEAVHVERDISELKSGPQLTLPDFGPPTKIVCHRDFRNWRRPGERFSSSGDIPESMREFFAEEAGRAAAVSYQALSRSEAFQGFCRLGDKGTTKDNGEMWRLLNLAAWEIGVNRSALVKQLDLEGRIIVEQKGGRKIIHLQPAFSTLIGGR